MLKFTPEQQAAINAARAGFNLSQTALAAQLATNAKGFTADDFKAMGLKRCKELAANASLAAPGAMCWRFTTPWPLPTPRRWVLVTS